jgi:hypothetical protein
MNTFKELAEIEAQSAVYWKKRFNHWALLNFAMGTGGFIFSGVYVWTVPWPMALFGLALCVPSISALLLAVSCRRQAQKAFEDFMKLREENLENARRFPDE